MKLALDTCSSKHHPPRLETDLLTLDGSPVEGMQMTDEVVHSRIPTVRFCDATGVCSSSPAQYRNYHHISYLCTSS